MTINPFSGGVSAQPAHPDLTSCDREPIHVPAAIQPHGVLLVLDPATLGVLQFAGDTQGMLGVAPEASGEHPTLVPTQWGGNMDIKHLRPGTTLYLLVAVEGALFAVGDTHAAMGDAEVCGTAVECDSENLFGCLQVRFFCKTIDVVSWQISKTADLFSLLNIAVARRWISGFYSQGSDRLLSCS